MGFIPQLNHCFTGWPSYHFVGQFGHGAFYFRVIETSPHKSFDREKGILWIGHCLPLGNLADVTFSSFCIQRNDGRCDPAAFGVLYDHGFAGFDDCRYRVCGSEVDSQDFSHLFLLNSNALVTISVCSDDYRLLLEA